MNTNSPLSTRTAMALTYLKEAHVQIEAVGVMGLFPDDDTLALYQAANTVARLRSHLLQKSLAKSTKEAKPGVSTTDKHGRTRK